MKCSELLLQARAGQRAAWFSPTPPELTPATYHTLESQLLHPLEGGRAVEAARLGQLLVWPHTFAGPATRHRASRSIRIMEVAVEKAAMATTSTATSMIIGVGRRGWSWGW